MIGLKIMCKPVVGLKQKNCQLFSGRGICSIAFGQAGTEVK